MKHPPQISPPTPEQATYSLPASAARSLPHLAPVRQRFDTAHIADVPAAVIQACAHHAPATIQAGMRVAITAGSRGITGIAEILATVVAEVRHLGASPFIVAAMGSHGGATSEGQRAVLAGYGITEERMGCPISTSMETRSLGSTTEGVTVYCDRAASEADAIILVNRVKPHSILVGELGSGLMKMAALGLGKAVGANMLHTLGLEHHLLPVARMVLAQAPVAFGIAIVENAYDQTWKIEGVPLSEIETADRLLLVAARALLPTIPFDPLDVLVVDTMGKNFSGTGMDPNVIGMHRRIGGLPQRQIQRIVALDLSAESHGNAHGIGMADIITQRLRAKIDWQATYTNGLTAGWPGGAKLPLTCTSGHDAVLLALQPFDPRTVRLARIENTAHLERLWVSETLLSQLAHDATLEQVGPPAEPNFD